MHTFNSVRRRENRGCKIGRIYVVRLGACIFYAANLMTVFTEALDSVTKTAYKLERSMGKEVNSKTKYRTANDSTPVGT